MSADAPATGYVAGIDFGSSGRVVIRFAFRGVEITIVIPDGVQVSREEADAIRDMLWSEDLPRG